MPKKIRNEELRRVANTVRIPNYLIEWMNKQEVSNSVLIEKALVKVHSINIPLEID